MVDVDEKAKDSHDAVDVEAKVLLPACYGIKAGMTRIFDASGNHVPVTIIKLVPNYVSQVKTKQKDNYEAYQIAYGAKRAKLVNRPKQGVLLKANIKQHFAHFAEIRMPVGTTTELSSLGKQVEVVFEPGSYVDICGVSKGKGFQGVVRKFGFRGGPKSHGSKFHRTGGSIGNRATPGKVWKNKKMPGQMGAVIRTAQNLRVIELNREGGYLLVQGAVPGSKNHFVRIGQAVKK